MAKILIVEDEKAINDLVKFNLELVGHECSQVFDGESGLTEALKLKYDLIILDVMLPKYSGFEIMEYIEGTPVIFVTAKSTPADKIKGLRLGADDYITKPFLPQELLFRIKAVLKRTYRIEEKMEKTQIGAVVIDWEAGSLTSPKESYMLTAKEYTLLKKLCDNRGKILSMNILCDTLWPDGSYGYENSLMVHMRRLREKIEENPSKPEYLVTVRGLGYKLK